MWTSTGRDGGGRIYCSGKNRFIQKLLRDQILTYFNAGETRHQGSVETFKQFAAQIGNRDELWIRPRWEIAHVEFLPEVFPEPKPLPVRTPEQREAKAEGDRRRAVIRQSKSQMASRGLVYSQARGSWGKPD